MNTDIVISEESGLAFLPLSEERILVLDADDPFPPDEWPACTANDR